PADLSKFRHLQPQSHDPAAQFGSRPARTKTQPADAAATRTIFDRKVKPAGREELVVPPAPIDADGKVIPGAPRFQEYERDAEFFNLASPEEDPFSLSSPEPGFRPGILDKPADPLFFDERLLPEEEDSVFEYESDEPLGFSGPSGILPTEDQESSHFVPIEDRWRVGIPPWDRYATPTPTGADAPFEPGAWWNPYRQHVLKGDYPIIGQHTFLNITATSVILNEFRQVPTPTTPFESTVNPFEEDFFGNPNQYFTTNYFRVKFDLFHGNAGFKPVDWRIVAEPVFNMNYLDVGELGVVNTNVRAGTTRFRDYMALEQWFVEAKLADLSPHYDFLSIRPRGESRSVQPGDFQPAGKGHQQRSQFVPQPGSDRCDRQLLSAGLPVPGVHGPGECSLQPRRADF
ncbi:MAG: hypothetical protein NT069_15635, partial [Planctomycetota bacterium]|nr:hypothetical protein [Planctomycetota bacterium]